MPDVLNFQRKRTRPTAARPRRPDPDGEATRQEKWRETARFWFWSILIMLVLRVFLLEPYRIPTPSMERTLLVGDFLFVSKLHYGARTPNTLGIPFTGIYLRGVELPQTRLPGFSAPGRGDVAVFNYPPDLGPVERRTPYIKRLVGVPGDRVLLVDKVLYVNDERFPLSEHQEQHWRVTPAEGQPLTPGALRVVGADVVGQVQRPAPAFVANATPSVAARMGALPTVGAVEPFVLPDGAYSGDIFPAGRTFNRDNYGPLTVPRRGDTVELSAETWPLYQDVVTRFEGRTAALLPDGTFQIDGYPATTYTFAQDYYFAMGDNRDNSQDSRYWGFVPYDHLIGRAVFVFFSIDLDNRVLGVLPTPRLRGLLPIR